MMSIARSLKVWSYPARRRIASAVFPANRRFEQARPSYSSSGEDLVAMAWLMRDGIDPSRMRYLDIGAADPVVISNTYLFSTLGASGVLVEPDPDQAARLRTRTGDIVVNAGVAFDDRRKATLTRFTSRLFNTFSEEYSATVLEQSGKWQESQIQKVVDRIEVPLIDINTIIETYLNGIAPDFLSIDAESVDYQILASLDLARFRPAVICSELSCPLERFAAALGPHGYTLVCRTPDNAMFYRPSMSQAG